MPFLTTRIWPARLTFSSQSRSRRNAQQALVDVARRRRDREDLARFLTERGIKAG